MFTISTLTDSDAAREYYAVLSSPNTHEHIIHPATGPTSTPPRWDGECSGLGQTVTPYEFQAVCVSHNVRAAYGFTFSPSMSISRTYERLLQRHDWHHAHLILQAVENAASHVMHGLLSDIGLLVWAGRTYRWQRADRQGICWNAVLFDISSADNPTHRNRKLHILRNRKTLDTTFFDAFTECLTNAWPEWRNATG